MENLGYYNGKYGPLEEMTVPMNDRACWFGDGVYDAGPSRNYRIYALDEHVDRFFRSAAAVGIRIPVTKQELKDLLNELIRKLDSGDQLVYFQVSRGTAPRDHVYSEEMTGNLWITMRPAPVNYGTEKIRLITHEDTRYFHCNVKTLNLLPAVIYANAADRAGCAETVLYRPGGRITECAHSNVHILKNGELITAPLDNLILPGIARAHLLAACRRLGIPVREEEYFLPQLRDADEIIVTSSSNFCVPAGELDGKVCGGKAPALLEKLRAEVVREFLEATKA